MIFWSSLLFWITADDAQEGIDGIIPIPCISLKEEVGKTGAAAMIAENSPEPKRSHRGSF